MILRGVLVAAGLALAVPMCRSIDAHSTVDRAETRYVANAGVLIRVEGRTFLVDAAFRDGIAPYAVSTAEDRLRLEEARDIYADVDAVLVTHWHEDHFDPAAVAAHLSRNTRAILISSAEVVDRVRRQAPDLPAARFRPIVPPPGGSEQTRIGDVPVHVIRARHNPTRRIPEEHLAFLIGERTPVLHVGDADPTADNFALLASLPAVDVAVVPFWYLLNQPSRTMVGRVIRPRRTVAVHLPPGEAAQVAQALAEASVTTSLATTPGQSLVP